MLENGFGGVNSRIVNLFLNYAEFVKQKSGEMNHAELLNGERKVCQPVQFVIRLN